MSSQRYSLEFKDESVRQIIKRCYSVAEVFERLGVSSYSLYQWIKAIKLDKTEQQTAQRVEPGAKRQTPRPVAESEEERDIGLHPRIS